MQPRTIYTPMPCKFLALLVRSMDKLVDLTPCHSWRILSPFASNLNRFWYWIFVWIAKRSWNDSWVASVKESLAEKLTIRSTGGSKCFPFKTRPPRSAGSTLSLSFSTENPRERRHTTYSKGRIKPIVAVVVLSPKHLWANLILRYVVRIFNVRLLPTRRILFLPERRLVIELFLLKLTSRWVPFFDTFFVPLE